MQAGHSADKASAVRYQLGEWQVDVGANLLIRGDERRSLRAKAMELLLLFLQRPDETIGRDEIVASIWRGNEAVAAQGINNAIWSIRQALDDDADAPRYLQTIPKKGYRLIAAVHRGEPPAQTPATAALAVAVARSEPLLAGTRSRRDRAWYKWRIGGALLLLAGSIAVWLTLPPQRPNPIAVHYANVSPLTQYNGMEYLGQLSPDGTMLAFAWWQGTGKGQLYLRSLHELAAAPIRVDGAEHDIMAISWAPDGKRLAFAERDNAGRCQVAVYSLQTAAVTRVADCLPLWTPLLAWSPQSSLLAYTGTAEADGAGLFLLDLANGDRRQLTHHDTLLSDHQPAWSPDGQRIAFVRSQAADASRDLYLTDLHGNVTRLTTRQFRDLHGLTWRHDSEALVYSTTQHGSRMLWQFDLLQHRHQPLGLEGSAPQAHPHGLLFSLFKKHQRIGRVAFNATPPRLQPLAGGITSEQSPDYSPSQQALVFVSARSGERELWQSDAEGQQAQQLTALKDTASQPRWSPDGSAIAFIGSCEPGRYGLCLLHVPTGKVLPLHTAAENYRSPVWTDDGQSVLLIVNHQGRQQLWSVPRDGRAHRVLPTRYAPDRLQKRANTNQLYYQAKASQRVHLLDLATGTEQPFPGPPWPEHHVAWIVLPGAVLVLSREQTERWHRLLDADPHWQTVAEFPLGTFAEFPQLSAGAHADEIYAELADTAYADLMLATPAATETAP